VAVRSAAGGGPRSGPVRINGQWWRRTLKYPGRCIGRARDIMAIKTKSERGPAGTLTVDDLTRAIKDSIDRTGMQAGAARGMAQHVLNFIGYSERIIDNVLEPEDRD